MSESEVLAMLIRGGIAPRRARRILREFAEHHADIVAERIALGEPAQQAEASAAWRLGSQESLAVRMLMRPELKCFSRRWPFAAYALVPILGYFLLLIALGGLMVGLFDLHIPGASRGLAFVSRIAVLFGAPAATAWLLMRESARRLERSRWPLVGLSLLCLIGALTNFGFVDRTATSPGQINMGIGIDSDHLGPVVLRAAATAMFASFYTLWRKRRQARN